MTSFLANRVEPSKEMAFCVSVRLLAWLVWLISVNQRSAVAWSDSELDLERYYGNRVQPERTPLVFHYLC